MDINKTYKNRNLELRRQQLIQRQRAEAVLRKSKHKAPDVRDEVGRAFRGINSGPLSAAIVRSIRGKRRIDDVDCLRRLMDAVMDRSALLEPENHRTYIHAIIRLARRRSYWIRQPEDWRPSTYNVGRQFTLLARHLLVRYPMPSFFDRVWLNDEPRQHDWYLHVAGGGNLRHAPYLPVTLTKMMAHHAMHAPPNVEILQALRYGQARGIGVSERPTRAILGTRVGGAFDHSADVEAFWATVLNFFALHPMMDAHQVGPIIDYLHHQKFVPAPAMFIDGRFVQQGPAQPGLSMKGRDPVALVAQVEAWHHRLNRRSATVQTWMPCGIAGYERVEGDVGNQRLFTVKELLSSAELRDEGSAMRHCVATYTSSCSSHRTAIYSLQVTDADSPRRLCTIEVDVKGRRITQARGRFNATSTPLDQRIMNAWATVSGLTIASYALSRAY